MEDSVEDEIRLLSRFEKHDEFLELQSGLLSLDPLVELSTEETREEDVLMQKLSLIFDEYQEQSYLLDPFLEKLVVPVAEKLKQDARVLVSMPHNLSSFIRLSRISTLLYYYIKCRGHKAIIRYFPHEIADLSIALQFSQALDVVKDTSIWSLRYVTLLWLSLICMIPFDLAQFDDAGQAGQTALAIETVAKSYLGKAGLEREGATILLSRLLVRKDIYAQRTTFLAWSCSSLGQDYELFQVLGILQSLCSIAKICPSDLVADQIPDFLNAARLCAQNSDLAANTLVRKYRVKLLARSALRLLPGRTRFRPHQARILHLTADQIAEHNDDNSDMIPDEIETIIQDLVSALQDRDTVVRWSAAKGIARIAERLPADFAEQVLETVMDLFTIHSIAVTSLYDMPAVAESTWHGACLACGEMARRDLISDEKLKELIAWMSKALYFDIRKGAHSIGSSVRDAAAYVLWSLARIPSQDVLKPFANGLAQDLLRVSLYDREIHIRRAASATFQEYVGRTGLFPHGIDVLRHTDFFAVAVRRNAFLIAAPDVAVHEEYQQALLDHVLNITLRHWDPVMRSLGAESLRKICELDLRRLGPVCMERAHKLLRTEESSDIHGALVALTQLADAFSHSPDDVEFQGHRQKIFALLEEVPLSVIRAPHNELLAAAACYLIANSVSAVDVKMESRYQSSEPFWLSVINIGLNHRSVAVQEAATAAMAQVSEVIDCSSMVESTLIREFRTGTPAMQQSLARLLGRLDYSAHPHGFHEAIQCLITSVDKSPLTRMMNVESRRNCYVSLPQILNTIASDLVSFLKPDTVSKMFAALLAGLEDYTTDERGDVGSWIRIACIQGLTAFICILFTHASQIPQFPEYLPSSQYHAAVAGILKQGVERLDNVRQEAGACLQKLLEQPSPSVVEADAWRMHQGDLIRRLFFSDADGSSEWQNGSWLFPRAVQLLDISYYRQDVLSGLLLSINSKTSSTQRPVRNSLIAYARKLPVAGPEDAYSLRNLTHDLIKHARVNLQSNYIVIPVLQTFNVLLDADILDGLTDDPQGLHSLRTLFVISSSNVHKLKNVQRLHSSMNIIVRLLTFTELFQDCLARLVEFLTHPYPKIRSDTAESLYLLLQTKDIATDTTEAESLLLETEWFSSDVAMLQETARQLVSALSS